MNYLNRLVLIYESNKNINKCNISKFTESIDTHINNVCNLSFIDLQKIKK